MSKANYEGGFITRTKILKAAKHVFLEKGYGATSMGQIAEYAEIPKSLLYHHFINKEDLWHGVKSLIVQQHLPETETIDHLACQSFRDYLTQVLTLRFDMYMTNPDVIRLISWQYLQGGEEKLAGYTPASPPVWLPALRDFQDKGLVRKDISPETMMILINGAISAATVDLTKYNFSDPSQYLEEVITLLESALTA